MPLIIQDESTKCITGPGGLPIEQVDGSGAVSYYLQDQLGSTGGLIDGSGNVVGTYEFGAYGNLESHTGASTPFGYAGHYTDAESGFQYLRARYYDPSTDQFMTVDPLVGVTLQPYAYTGGDPLNGSDPSGLWGPGDVFSVIGGMVHDLVGAITAKQGGRILPPPRSELGVVITAEGLRDIARHLDRLTPGE